MKERRIMIAPLSQFASIQQFNRIERKRINIIDDELIMFHDCDEVFHLEQFLGREQEYKYQIA